MKPTESYSRILRKVNSLDNKKLISTDLLTHFKLTPRYKKSHGDSINCVILPLDKDYEYDSLCHFMNTVVKDDVHLVRDFYNPENVGLYINGFGVTFSCSHRPNLILNPDTGHLVGYAEYFEDTSTISIIRSFTNGKNYFLFNSDESELSEKDKKNYFDCEYYLTSKQTLELLNEKF